MGLMDKAKQAADVAKVAANQAVEQAQANTGTSQAIRAQLKQAGKFGRQEKANAALKVKGSIYRIAEITITATIPPQIGFAVARIGDVEEEELSPRAVQSSELLAAGVTDMDTAVVSLYGEAVDVLEDVE